jgi:tetratricopeptide (TPR) repeat protein
VADAHALLAFSVFALEWAETPKVDGGFRRALELDPNSVNTLVLLGVYQCFSGRVDEALGNLDRAEQLDPLSPIPPMTREVCNYGARRYQAVIEAHRRTAAIDPSFVYLQSWVGNAYRELGDYPAAQREFETAAGSLEGAPQYGLGLTYVRMGRDLEARDVLRRMEERSRTRYVPCFMRAVLHAAFGDLDRAVALLQQAVDDRETFVFWLRSLPEAAPLAADPRAQRIFEHIDAIRTAG